MYKFFAVVLVCLFSFSACQDAGVEVDEKIVAQVGEEVNPTHVATLEIEGMVCEKECGSAIREGLYETGGVSKVDIEFDESNPVNNIRVYFDEGKTSVEDVIYIIDHLANQQYNAKFISISKSTLDREIL